MKKLLYLCLVLITINFTACKSEFTNDIKTQEDQSGLSNGEGCDELLGLDRVPIYPNEFAIEELLLNPEDASDQDINVLLYTLSEAIKPLSIDCNFNSKIIEMANASPLNAASLLDLKEQAPKYYELINRNLPSGLSIESIAQQMVYRNPDGSEAEQYDPGIFIPNLENASLERQVLLSAQLAYKGNERHLGDAILCTYYTGEGEFEETWVGEYIAEVSTNPIFVIDLLQQSVNGSASAVDLPEYKNVSSTTAQTCNEYYITNYAIAHRYETNNHSEYYYASFFYFANGQRQAGGGELIKSIHKNNINQTQYDPSHIRQLCDDYSNAVRMALVTFERDWNNSVKNVFFDGNQFQLNMRYSSQWYQRIVFDVDGSNYTEYSKGFVGLESTAVCSDCPPGYSFDGASCYAGVEVPPGYFLFIWGNSFYATANCSIPSGNNCCPVGFGWDTANCHSGISIPAGWQGFIWDRKFYVHAKCL